MLLVFVILFACDTKSDFEDDFKKYYLKYYGEDGDQEAVDMVVNDDGTVLLLGNTISVDGRKRIMLMKVDPQGNALWTKRYGDGIDNQGRSINENAQDIEPLVDASGFYILSNMVRKETSTNEDLFDFKVIRITPDGIVADTMEFGNNITGNTQFIRSITPTLNGGFVVTGNSTNGSYLTETGLRNPDSDIEDVFTIGFDAQYNQLWSTAPASQGEYFGSGVKAFEVIETRLGSAPDTVYYSFHYSDRLKNDAYESNFWPFKITTRGRWFEEPSAGSNNYNELLSFVCKVPPELGDGFYEIGTQVEGTATSGSIYFCKRNRDLTIKDEGRISVPGEFMAMAVAPSKRSSGFLILANEVVPTGTIVKLIKVEAKKSNYVWSMPFGSPGKDGNSGARVEELADGTILLFCTIELETQKKMALLRLNSRGQLLD